MPPEDYYIEVIRDCENKCGNLKRWGDRLEGRNICNECIEVEHDSR